MKTVNYEKWLALQQYKPESIRTLRSLVNQLTKYLTKEGFILCTESISSFAHWTTLQGYTLTYQKHLHWGIRNYCSYLKQVQDLKIQVLLPKVKNLDRRREALSQTALLQISNWLKKQIEDYWLNQSLWSLFYGCGLRRKEALNLELKDLQISSKLLQVHTVKGGKYRTLPLSNKQVKSLVNYVDKERPSPKLGFEHKLLIGRIGGRADSVLNKTLNQWQKSTGLGQKLCWHVLRHSIATELVQKGMKIEEVSRFLGHTSIESTTRYLHHKKQENEL